MTHCLECGEKIAKVDRFCPHCGITLEPVAIATDAEELPEEASITTQPVVLGPLDAHDSGHTGTSPAKIEDAVDKVSEISEESIESVGPSDLSEPSADEVPVFEEKFEEVLPETSESVDSVADQPPLQDVVIDQPTPESPEQSSDQIDYLADHNRDSADVVEGEVVIAETSLEDFVPEQTSIDETSANAEPTAETPVESESPDEIEDSESFETPELKDQAESNEVAEPADESAEVPEFSSDVEGLDVVAPSVPALLKPEFESEVGDVQSDAPFIESVSNIEIQEEPREDSPDETPIGIVSQAASEERTFEAGEPAIVAAELSDEKTDQERRSYTSPNMGKGDTDGKKSKLKPLDEGTVLNSRYEIVRKIGGGGMGAVYLASDKNLGGVLRAVKEMVQSYIEETAQEKAINDFKRESMLLTSLEHPSIPTIYDYFYDETEARFYLVMKYINGGDLSSRLHSAPEGRIDELKVVEWAIQIADVLDYLHKREPPIVYRDLKPANVMIDGNNGKVMLIDFGIARWINKEEKGVTAVGTMGYAPPELFSGNVEPRSDIYSLGSTMFHLLTGADPQSNPLLIFDFQKNPRPRQINPQLSDQIEGILMLAVEYNAEKRFASTAEFRRALEDHLEKLQANRVTFGVKESPKAVTLSDEKVFCGFCGQSIVASDLFCAFCGAKQPIAQKGVHSESYSSVPVTARLTIIGTNELDSPSYKIEKDENLVGRRDPMSNIFPEVDLSKFDPQTKISRRHARIWRDGNKFLVEDLGSSNGTILVPVINKPFRLVPNQPQLLTNGDRLKLGDTTLHFDIG